MPRFPCSCAVKLGWDSQGVTSSVSGHQKGLVCQRADHWWAFYTCPAAHDGIAGKSGLRGPGVKYGPGKGGVWVAEPDEGGWPLLNHPDELYTPSGDIFASIA